MEMGLGKKVLLIPPGFQADILSIGVQSSAVLALSSYSFSWKKQITIAGRLLVTEWKKIKVVTQKITSRLQKIV